MTQRREESERKEKEEEEHEIGRMYTKSTEDTEKSKETSIDGREQRGDHRQGTCRISKGGHKQRKRERRKSHA
jgi:hypothetical protein